jgi:hypothetical protein
MVERVLHHGVEKPARGRRGAWLACMTAMLAGACASGQDGPPPRTPPEVRMNATLQSITEAVLDDAARLAGVERSALTIVSREAVTWSDGSLGCSQPGMGYTQALVPGYRVRLRAGDREFDYHASARGQWILCPPGRATDPAPRDAI